MNVLAIAARVFVSSYPLRSITFLTIRSIVLTLSLVSFIPQFHRLWRRRDNSGISLFYLLLNSMMFTEHFALGSQITLDSAGNNGKPPTAEELLDFYQFFGVWFCSLML